MSARLISVKIWDGLKERERERGGGREGGREEERERVRERYRGREGEKERERTERGARECVLSESEGVMQWQIEQYTMSCKFFTNLSGYIY